MEKITGANWTAERISSDPGGLVRMKGKFCLVYPATHERRLLPGSSIGLVLQGEETFIVLAEITHKDRDEVQWKSRDLGDRPEWQTNIGETCWAFSPESWFVDVTYAWRLTFTDDTKLVLQSNGCELGSVWEAYSRYRRASGNDPECGPQVDGVEFIGQIEN